MATLSCPKAMTASLTSLPMPDSVGAIRPLLVAKETPGEGGGQSIGLFPKEESWKRCIWSEGDRVLIRDLIAEIGVEAFGSVVGTSVFEASFSSSEERRLMRSGAGGGGVAMGRERGREGKGGRGGGKREGEREREGEVPWGEVQVRAGPTVNDGGRGSGATVGRVHYL